MVQIHGCGMFTLWLCVGRPRGGPHVTDEAPDEFLHKAKVAAGEQRGSMDRVQVSNVPAVLGDLLREATGTGSQKSVVRVRCWTLQMNNVIQNIGYVYYK